MKYLRVCQLATFSILLVITLLPKQSLFAAQWQPINIGGGGAMNVVGAGPTGTLVAGTDLAGAYIKKQTDETWTIIGPLNGVPETHITGVAFDQNDKNIILLASEGGIYRSTNEGLSFTRVDRLSPTATDFIGGKYLTLAYQQDANSNSRRVYASKISQFDEADGQVLRSDDGGQSFSLTAPLPNASNTVITKIVIHPANPDLVLALSNEERFLSPQNALYMSLDGGESWSEIAANISNINDVVFHPIAPHAAYISSKPASDSASVFTRNLGLETDTSWISIFTTPFYDDEFYQPILILWADASEAHTMRAININTVWQFDAQTAWRILKDGANQWKNQPLGESSDWAGDQANWKLGWSKNFSILAPTLESVNHTIGFDLSDTNSILWATNQFVHRAKQVSKGASFTLEFENLATKTTSSAQAISDETATWSSTGLDNITPFILDVNQSNPKVIYAGLNDLGCVVSKDAGATWKLCIHNSDSWLEGFNFTKSYGGVATALASDPADAARVWMFAAGDQGSPALPLRSDEFGDNWTAMSWGGSQPSTSDIYGLSVDTSSDVSQRRLYVTVDGAVYRSQDHGNHWEEVFACDSGSSTLSGCRVTKVAPDGMVYAGGENGLFVSKDKGQTWQAILSQSKIEGGKTGDVFASGEWSGISGIAINPDNSNSVYAAAFIDDDSQGIYQCDASGTINIDSNCQLILTNKAYIRDVAVDPNNAQNLFATSSSAFTAGGFDPASAGVLRSTDGGATWTALNDGLDWPMAYPIQVDPQDGNIIYVGSPGGGHYKIDLNNEDNPDDSSSDDKSGGGVITLNWWMLFGFLILLRIRSRNNNHAK